MSVFEPHHSIRVAARRTGLSAHAIRVWERRYKAVTPTRTDTNRRLYSDADIERLSLLKRATLEGHSIGHIAGLPTEELVKLAFATATAPQQKQKTDFAEELVARSLEAIRAMNTADLEQELALGLVRFGQHGLLEDLVAPLAQRVGDLWRDGQLLAAHEHFASSVIRTFLARNSRPFAGEPSAPCLLVSTPPGQLHELGAVMVAAAASDIGWRVIYLGPSLPAGELAAAALQNNARAVALSLVYPEDDPNMSAELRNLRRYLPAEVSIIAGGRAAPAYEPLLKEVGAYTPPDFRSFYAVLDSLRSRHSAHRSGSKNGSSTP